MGDLKKVQFRPSQSVSLRTAAPDLDATGVDLVLGDAVLKLLPGRAVFWPSQRALVLADVHLGKTSTLAANGSPISDCVDGPALESIAKLVAGWSAERIIVVGDLLHAPIGVIEPVIERVAAWRKARIPDQRFTVVLGNHDRRIEKVAARWNLEVCPDRFAIDGCEFVHDPAHASIGVPFIAGHLHPAVSIGVAADRMKLPCFHRAGHGLILPAFSPFTGGALIRPQPGDRVFAVAPHEVFEVPSHVWGR